MFICQVLCTGIQGIYALLIGGSISQSRFVCQVWCSSIQGIYSWFPGGIHWSKVGSSAKFGVAVFKASILYSLGDPSAKVCSSACQVGGLCSFCGIQGIYALLIGGSISQSRFICQVWCSSIQGIYSWLTGGPSSKVGLSAKFGVAVFKASILYSLGGPSAKVCSSAKFLCTGIQGIYALLIGGSICQSRFVCQVWCSSIQGIYSLINWGVHLPSLVLVFKVGSSAKCLV